MYTFEPMGRATADDLATIPGAEAGGTIVWPVPGFTYFSMSSFGGDRPSSCSGEDCERNHCGVDILAPFGQITVAMGAGVVIATQGWASKKGRTDRTSQALLLQLDGGPVIVYGGMEPKSWERFGVKVGVRVRAGQPVCSVGYYPNGSTMAHMEARRRGTKSAKPWTINTPPPSSLLNLTPLLVRAKKGTPAEWRPAYNRKKPRPAVPPPILPPDDDEIILLDDDEPEPDYPRPPPPPPPMGPTEQGQWLDHDPEPVGPPAGGGILDKLAQALQEMGQW
jgi:hypothetical protein